MVIALSAFIAFFLSSPTHRAVAVTVLYESYTLGFKDNLLASQI